MGPCQIRETQAKQRLLLNKQMAPEEHHPRLTFDLAYVHPRVHLPVHRAHTHTQTFHNPVSTLKNRLLGGEKNGGGSVL